jgi:transcriptional regulator with XRE-family HTH domain
MNRERRVCAVKTPNFVEPQILARRLRAEMGAQKVSRKRLAELTDISRRALANKLDGQVSFTYDEVARIATSLGLDPGVLFDA